MIGELILFPVSAFLGWLYLWIRYRDKQVIKRILLEKYDNSYSRAGGSILLKSFAILWLGVLFTFVLVMIISLFKTY